MALLAPVTPPIPLKGVLATREGWDRADDAAAAADGTGDAERPAPPPAAPSHMLHGVALLPTIGDHAALLDEAAGGLLTDVLRRGLLPAALQAYRERLLRILKGLVRESVEGQLAAFTARAIEGSEESPFWTWKQRGKRHLLT